jgi:hypothetical protein
MARRTSVESLRSVGEVRFPAHDAITWQIQGSSLGAELVRRAEGQVRLPRSKSTRARVYLDSGAFVVRFYAPAPRRRHDPGVHDDLPEFPTRLAPETPPVRPLARAAVEVQKSVPMEMDPGAIYEALRERRADAIETEGGPRPRRHG